MFHNVIFNVIGPGVNACWSFLNTLWGSISGFAPFFIAIFTMICAIRFFVMPFVGYHRTYASRTEERPSSYQDPQRDFATWASMRGM